MIPNNAILDSGDKQTVFLALDGGKFEPRRVKVGLQGDDGMTQILEGLASGDKVVTDGEFLLDSESQLQEAVQKMLDTGLEENAEPMQMEKGKSKDSDMNDLFNDQPEKKKENLNDLF